MKVIVRHVKHKSIGTIAAAGAHATRSRPTPNADPNKPPPEVWVGSAKPIDDVKSVLPAKRRKNAVLALEYILTASPEFFTAVKAGEWRSYLRNQLTMLCDYYRAENVVSAILHLDEKTPHLSVLVVPLIDGKLNARALIGTREACSIIQDLAGDVGGGFGLERGARGSKATHQDVKQFYADIRPSAQRAADSLKDAEDQRLMLDAERQALARAKQVLGQQEHELNQERLRLKMLADSLTPIEEERAAAKLDALNRANVAPASKGDNEHERRRRAPTGRRSMPSP